MGETLQHLVLIRHGESDGDLRRAAWKRGEVFQTHKKPEEEALTAIGEEQMRLAGIWIAKNIIEAYGIKFFDGCHVSSALRSEQSAMALDLPITVWQDDNNLDERNRGSIRGLRAEQHKQLFPESFREMKATPLYWVPPGPGAQAIVPDVTSNVLQYLENIESLRTAIAVTHRDWMWAAMQPLEGLDDEELMNVNTNEIHNAQIFHYTSIDPVSGEQAPDMFWKRSVDPTAPGTHSRWQYLSKLADLPETGRRS